MGDNTRAVLLNTDNEHWPLLTKSADGFVGMTILPRWAENIYYNVSLFHFLRKGDAKKNSAIRLPASSPSLTISTIPLVRSLQF